MTADHWLLAVTSQKSVEREIAEGKILLWPAVVRREVLKRLVRVSGGLVLGEGEGVVVGVASGGKVFFM